MSFDRTKFLARFVDEAREHVNKLNEGILSLEKNPSDPETLNAVFRSAHTVKGSSKIMKLSHITEMAHRLEDVLDSLRGGKIELSKGLSDILFSAVDAISEMIETTAKGQETTDSHDSVLEALDGASKGEKTEAPAKETKTPPSSDGLKEHPKTDAERLAKQKTAESIRIRSEKLDDLIRLSGEVISNQSRLKHRLIDINELLRLAKKTADIASLFGEGGAPLRAEELREAARSVLAGLKLVSSGVTEDANLNDILSGELQMNALSMRMLPLSTIFDGFQRSVRDISKSMGKNIELVIEGGETEIDKKMIEMLGDPLSHMIRNAVDHGIEGPEERLRAGKPETGTIRLFACYEGGNVHIELTDDGGGIPIEKIKEKAVKKKIYEKSSIEGLPEAEIINLIFHPGFSTSEIITDVSGRGVGMDVVKKNIVEEIKGSIHVSTKRGRGTTFHIRLPLTLAITNVLIITVSGFAFAIPSGSVSEIIRARASDLIDVVDRKAIRLREQIIPVVGIGEILGLPEKDATGRRNILILIVSTGSGHFGLIVDFLIDAENMVIKPMPPLLKNFKWVSGVIVGGRNKIINVLHIPKIIEVAKELKGSKAGKADKKAEKRRLNILVVDDSINTREIEKSILEAYGYNVTLAADGVEAFDKAMEFKYDIVITDIEMPRMDGFTLTERLRKEEGYRETPIILLTSRDKEEDKKRGIEAGADAYIMKGSFDQSQLIETIQNLSA